MDPEQVYQEVLQEEQQKGSPSVIAEARAKAARVRTEHESPHPKEPKWWPGAQPQFEGGEAAPEASAAEEPAPEVEAPAEEPAAAEPEAPAPQPAAEEPAAATQAAPAQEQSPAPAAAAEQAPAAAEVPPQPAAVPSAPAAVAEAELPPEARPSGVTHGTTTGTRLRPEDEVTTEAQFEGQKAMYQRRKLIDDLVATGVPEVTAAGTSTSSSSFLAVLYVLIPVLALVLLSGLKTEGSSATEPPPQTAQPADGGGGLTVTASNLVFDTTELTLPAGESPSLEFVNEDPAGTPHNISILESEGSENVLFRGDLVDGGGHTTYEVPALDPGRYYFQCDVHPAMNGAVTVE